MMNHEENHDGDEVPNSQNNGGENPGMNESEHPLIAKLKNEIIQLQQSLEIRLQKKERDHTFLVYMTLILFPNYS